MEILQLKIILKKKNKQKRAIDEVQPSTETTRKKNLHPNRVERKPLIACPINIPIHVTVVAITDANDRCFIGNISLRIERYNGRMEVTAAPEIPLHMHNTVYEQKKGNISEDICPIRETRKNIVSLLFESPIKENSNDRGHPDRK